MKTKVYIGFFIALSLISVLVLGCAAKNGVYGQPFSETNLTKIGDILANPQQYERETVQINGKIIEECPAGGWFILKDATGVIYVDLHSSYFAIPQAIGSDATAEGIIKKDGTRITMTGKGVKIK